MRKSTFLALAALPLASCGEPPQTFIDKGYVRLPAVDKNPGVAYFSLHGGTRDNRLISVTSPTTIKTEMHESMMNGNRVAMAPIKDIPVPARATVNFAPGGKHVMLFSIDASIKPGGTIPLIFTFADNLRIEYDAPVIAAGDTPPKK